MTLYSAVAHSEVPAPFYFMVFVAFCWIFLYDLQGNPMQPNERSCGIINYYWSNVSAES